MNTYINEMREWLLNMGYVDPFATDGLPEEKAEKTGELFRRFDAGELTGEEVEFLGIAQNLRQMTHTGISADKYGRLQFECSKMKRSVEMRRYVMPKAITGALICAAGKKGGDIRGEQQSREKAEKDVVETIHGERGLVSNTIKELARKKDQMGDPLNIKDELWPELIGILDELGNADEVLDEKGNPLRINYVDNNGKQGQVTFKSFQTMVYTERGKYK